MGKIAILVQLSETEALSLSLPIIGLRFSCNRQFRPYNFFLFVVMPGCPNGHKLIGQRPNTRIFNDCAVLL